jgi:two-component system, NarL family, response regulator DesR
VRLAAGRRFAGVPASGLVAVRQLPGCRVLIYLASAVTKLGARNRVDAVRIAAEAVWLWGPARAGA